MFNLTDNLVSISIFYNAKFGELLSNLCFNSKNGTDLFFTGDMKGVGIPFHWIKAHTEWNFDHVVDIDMNKLFIIILTFSFSFVFLQLYYHSFMATDDSRPILLPSNQEEIRRSIMLLDFIKPLDTHKIGVLYVRQKQTTEQEILSNFFGSLRYAEFLMVRMLSYSFLWWLGRNLRERGCEYDSNSISFINS